MTPKFAIIAIVDNSGGREARCINVPKNRLYMAGHIGDKLTLVITLAKTNKPIKKKQIHKGLLLRTIFKKKRKGVGFFRFDKNAAILLNKKNVPYAKRIKGSILDEFRFDLNYSKIISMVRAIV